MNCLPAMTRLARKAGVKSMSEECKERIQEIGEEKLEKILLAAEKVREERKGKILTVEDIRTALEINGNRVVIADKLGVKVVEA